jgi:hypothetical protein
MTHINQRRDTAANWAVANPVLQEGEVGWETNTRKGKLGDGTTEWNDLLYIAAAAEITADDIGLGNVENTSDLDKPISTAVDAALALKADTSDLAGLAPLASPTFTGSPAAPTPSTSDNDTSLATTAFVKNVLLGDPLIKYSSLTAKPLLVCTSGTRPLHSEGQAIYETDTDRIYVSDGATWNRVASSASGALTTSGVTSGGVTWEERNGVVTLDVAINTLTSTLTAGSSVTVVSTGNAMPAEYRPQDQGKYAPVFSGTAVGFVNVATTGAVAITASTASLTGPYGTLTWTI